MISRTIIRARAITGLWTGDMNRQNCRLRETGMLGSMRWWYESLVRGLRGYACGAINGGCDFDLQRKSKGEAVPRNEQICAACEMFGCNGWSRKFRLRLLDSEGHLLEKPINSGQEFILEFRWLRESLPEEIYLLVSSMKIASCYGSFCAKNGLVPQRSSGMLIDTGLVELIEVPDIQCTVQEAVKFVAGHCGKKNNSPDYPDLRWFFFGKGIYLDRAGLDTFIDRLRSSDGDTAQFMQGSVGISKKVFSFRAGGKRIWGYSRGEEELKTVMDALEKQFGTNKVLNGQEVIDDELL